MNKLNILSVIFCVTYLPVLSQNLKPNSEKQFDFITHNRSIEQISENGKSFVRLNESAGAGIAWIKDLEFSEGIIEFDAKGRDVLQKSFIGIAFHGIDNETYETVYFRPFNFQANDPVRKIHAVQYSFEPKFGFQELRNTRKDEFESPIKPTNLQASEWFHVKIEVKENRIRAFVNGLNEPCLNVTTLNPNAKGKKIGFWVGNNSNGDFANLKISN